MSKTRKIFGIVCSALFLFSLASCDKETPEQEGALEIVDGTLMSFSAGIDAAFTKAYADGTTGVVS